MPAGLAGRSVALEALAVGASVEASGAVVRTVGPAGRDPDQDGLSSWLEATLGTDPNVADSDGDTVDGDGLGDADEVVWGTDPNGADTDGGGASDGDEVMAGTDPLSASDG